MYTTVQGHTHRPEVRPWPPRVGVLEQLGELGWMDAVGEQALCCCCSFVTALRVLVVECLLPLCQPVWPANRTIYLSVYP